VQVWAKHCAGPVKSVIPVEVLDVMVIDYREIKLLRAFASRYFSVAVNRANANEIKVPVMDALVSPE
jgi:hypothetical protein